jgi:hypothetical protein
MSPCPRDSFGEHDEGHLKTIAQGFVKPVRPGHPGGLSPTARPFPSSSHSKVRISFKEIPYGGHSLFFIVVSSKGSKNSFGDSFGDRSGAPARPEGTGRNFPLRRQMLSLYLFRSFVITTKEPKRLVRLEASSAA